MKSVKILSVGLALCAVFLLMAATSSAEIYINDVNEDITVNEGSPLKVPLFFVGGSLQSKPVDLFIWKQVIDTQEKDYLNGNMQWVSFLDNQEIQPIVRVGSMVDYIYVPWVFAEDTTGMESFVLHVCMDGTYDGHLTAAATCSARNINIDPAPTATPTPTPTPADSCTGIVLSKSSISESVAKGASWSETLTIKNSCGNALNFSATPSQSWISLSKGSGSLTVTLNTSSLIANMTYAGNITVSAGGQSKTLAVSLQVTAATLGLGGGGSQCTPSSISVWPVSINAVPNVSQKETTSVTNNCGAAVSYSATVTSGNAWLSVPSSGSGTITVTAAGQGAGQYSGTVSIKGTGASSGLKGATLNVSVDVDSGNTPPASCTASSISSSPLSVSANSIVGSDAADATVNIQDNCGNAVPYTVTAISSSYTTNVGSTISWIKSPTVNATGTGGLTIKFANSALPAGTYRGTVTVGSNDLGSETINVTLVVASASVSTNASLIKNGSKYFNSFSSGQIRYYYFNENSDKGLGNNNALMINMADNAQYDGTHYVDMIVRYAGSTCDGVLPTLSDWKRIHSAWESGNYDYGAGWYASFSATSFETIMISAPNPEGCYYVMLYNTSTKVAPSIRIGYADNDSVLYPSY
ncbi:MAG: hypothetical protein P8Z71_07765 [Candidatus Sulfobium sp.]